MAASISLNRVDYVYQNGTPVAYRALENVNLKILRGSFTMIVGQTGSGKSTLAQLISGLIQPSAGQISVDHFVINRKTPERTLRRVHRVVGITFQIAEDQLFGETVWDNLVFALRNFKINQKFWPAVKRVCRLVGLPLNLLKRSPFDLSGGQMRKVVIASVLIYRPKILVLDEPTVGLDYYSQQQLMELLVNLNRHFHLTIVMITHRVPLIAKYASRVIVMQQGRALAQVTPVHLFTNSELLTRAGLMKPFAVRFADVLYRHGIRFSRLPLTNGELANSLANKLKMKMNRQ